MRSKVETRSSVAYNGSLPTVRMIYPRIDWRTRYLSQSRCIIIVLRKREVAVIQLGLCGDFR
jgi:hypothetical protein